jgi:hypothetical protein
MKLMSFLILLISLTGCTGWEDGLSGTIHANQGFLVKSSPRNLYIREGESPVRLELEEGIYGISSPEIIIHINDKKYPIVVPRTSFKENGALIASAKELEQSFSIKGKRVVKTIKTWSQEKSESCSYCGYCYSLQTTTDSNGNSKSEYGWGNSCLCSGNQDVIREYKLKKRYYEVKFVSKNGDELAKFIGKGNQFQESKVVEQLNSCN